MAAVDPSPPALAAPPSLGGLFACFARVTMLSVGGGLSAWIRRAVVEERRWLDEPHFLSGYALAQIAPGANAVNLAVFVGTTLRGGAGAAAAVAGLLAGPLVLILLLGWFYGTHAIPPPVAHALRGMGAAAIGLMIATGIRMGRSGLAGWRAIAVAGATAAGLALGLPLVPVAAAMLVAGLVLVR